MNDAKNKMYNYETPPPDGVWKAIATELDSNEAKVIPMSKKKNTTFYYIAAAAVALIIFSLIFFTNRSSESGDEKFTTSSDKTYSETDLKTNTIITVPTDEKITVNNNDMPAKHKVEKDNTNQKQNKEIKKTIDHNLIASNTSSYITVEGPQGQPVKINSKMATLIDSSETKIASKPIWNKKINEWREIMQANTLAPTPGNFLDIIELTKSLKDNK